MGQREFCSYGNYYKVDYSQMSPCEPSSPRDEPLLLEHSSPMQPPNLQFTVPQPCVITGQTGNPSKPHLADQPTETTVNETVVQPQPMTLSKAASYFMQVQQQCSVVPEEPELLLPPCHLKPMRKLSQMHRIKEEHEAEEHRAQEEKALQQELTHSGTVMLQAPTCWQQCQAFIWNHVVFLEQERISIADITKVKCWRQVQGENGANIKMTGQCGRETYMCVERPELEGQNEHYDWFRKIISNKLVTIKQEIREPTNLKEPKIVGLNTDDAIIWGAIFKKSQHLMNWESRLVVIYPNELRSYRDESGEPSFCIEGSSIKQIWTRFEKYSHCLVIKVRHGVMKTEFALPMVTKMWQKWLHGFYRLMNSPHKK